MTAITAGEEWVHDGESGIAPSVIGGRLTGINVLRGNSGPAEVGRVSQVKRRRKAIFCGFVAISIRHGIERTIRAAVR